MHSTSRRRGPRSSSSPCAPSSCKCVLPHRGSFAPAGSRSSAPRRVPPTPVPGRFHPGLLHAVPNDRDSKWPQFSVRLWDVHAPYGLRSESRRCLQLPKELSTVLIRQGHFPIHTGSTASLAELRHPADGYHRVVTRPQHQLLQVAETLGVPILRSLEDPLPQSTYVCLCLGPVHAAPCFGIAQAFRRSGGRVGRSSGHLVHLRVYVQFLVLSSLLRPLQRPTCPASALFRVRACARYPPGYGQWPRSRISAFSPRLSP